MPSFDYEALDASGRARKGVINAESARLARAELRRVRLTPIAISAAADKQKAGAGKKKKHISSGQLVASTRQLAVLLSAGVPLEEAIGAVALQTDNESARKRLLSVRERVTEGWRFSDALGEHGKSFPQLYRSVVAAGETSGDLAGVLDRLATMLEKNRSMRNKALGSMIYPIALALVAGGVITALMTLVVPKIIVQFEAFNAQLPLVTRFVIGLSGFIGAYGPAILISIVLLSIGLWQGLKRPAFKQRFDRQMLGWPIIGNLLRGLDGARFARTLSTLVAGGAPLLDAMRGAGDTVANAHVKTRIARATDQVREGASLAAALKKAAVLPSMMVHMISAGERAGQVPTMLDNAAAQLEEEFETATSVALRLLEPMIIILMGGVVMMIVVSIMLPMLQLNSLASG